MELEEFALLVGKVGGDGTLEARQPLGVLVGFERVGPSRDAVGAVLDFVVPSGRDWARAS